jgi:peptidoglycan/LPS O-acetylase OafA/YrhL
MIREKEHIVQLDGIRFFAVSMVILAHSVQWQWVQPWLTMLPLSQGVTLFFVLSGFLITKILLSNRDKYAEYNMGKSPLIKNFYIRRFLRIFPIYYLTIFFLFFINYGNAREIFPWLVSYTTNIYQSVHSVGLVSFNHFWSLAVEEQFYLFWPWIILFVNRKYLAGIIISTIVAGLLSKLYIFLFVQSWMAGAYFTLSCMHALGLGALIAWIAISENRCSYNYQNTIGFMEAW